MRRIVSLLLSAQFLLAIYPVIAQDGPGGVGSSSNVNVWLDASRLSLTNNDPVSSWTDVSGNNNHAAQSTGSNQPLYLTGQVNGLPAISFDGTDDRMEFTSAIDATAVTVFAVTSPSSSSLQSVVATDNHHISFNNGAMRAEYPGGFVAKGSPQSYALSYMYTSSEAVSSTAISLYSNNGTSSGNRTGFTSNTNNSIGARFVSSAYNFFFQGEMAEVIVYNELLNSAERKIVANYLASKYDLTAERNLFNYKSTHGNDVIGIGQESDGSHTSSRGFDSLQISNASALSNGEYVLVGNDGGNFSASSSVGTDAAQRWTKIWRADVTGSPGTVDLTFYLGANDFATDGNDYVVYIENVDGDFSNGGTSIQETGRSYNAGNNTVSFTGITLADGDYFTLAEKAAAAVRPTPVAIANGPGGVGGTSNMDIWLDASQLNLTNSDPVSSWTDVSGNQIDADQATASNQPTYLTNQVNGLPAISFDGTDDYLEHAFENTATAATIFAVVNPSSSSLQSVVATDNHHISFNNGTMRAEYPGGFVAKGSPQSYALSYMYTSSEAVSSTAISLYSNNGTSSGNRTGFISNTNNTVGARFLNGSYQYYFNGEMAEIIVYNELLNSAQRKIVANYLASKYDLTAEQNLFNYKSTHGNGVFGIGQESDGSHTEARSHIDSLEISNASALSNGEYVLVGNDGGNFSASSSVGTDAAQRWTRVWRADVTGSPGTVDLTFYLGANDFATDGNDYVVYIENVDGDFSNGGTSIQETGRSYNAGNNTVSFTGITLADGDYFTLAEKAAAAVRPTPVAIANGPGGVGGTSNMDIWLDASQLNLTNSDPVSSWTDVSGNQIDADQATASNQPTYLTNQVNGLPAISFDGTDDYLEHAFENTATAATIFAVVNPSSSSLQSVVATDNHHISFNNGTMRAEYPGGFVAKGSPQSYALSYMYTSSEAVSSTAISLYSNNGTSSGNRTGFISNTNNTVGARFLNGSYQYYFNGEMAEIIVYNELLNSAQRKIVANYLASKYDLTAEQNLFNYKSTHGNGVFGIGQESDGSHTEARSHIDSLEISNASALSNGEYVLVGNDGSGFTTSASAASNITEHWDRVWRADVTGSPGTISMEFFLGANGFAAISDYILIIDSDGDFSSGATIHTTGLSYNASNNSISFTGVSLTDGDYFTLAEAVDETSAQAGDWNSVSTWNCNCIPGSTENAIINHAVTISGNQSISDLTIGSSGSLTFSSNETLSIHGNMTVQGTFSSATGTIEAVNASGSQSFNSTSSSIFEFYNLTVNNNSGLNVQSGGWAVQNNLQVSSGGMDVTGTDSVVLYSTASATSQILQSMSNAFTGNFTVRRFIRAGSSRYSNLSAPTTSATVADLDDDLYLSGVGGNDADVLGSGGSVFRSVSRWDSPTDANVPLTTTASALSQGVGYDVYLDVSQPTITDTAIDFVGVPTSGSITVQVDSGWNLVGNPYHSFIDFGALTSTGLSSTYYIFSTINARYEALTSADPIAPEQAFWVTKSTAGSVNLTFDEADKLNSNSPSFLRRRAVEEFTLELQSLENNYANLLKVRFDPMASNGLDENDAWYLASPVKEVPGIYAKLNQTDKNLMINSLNAWDESHKIAIEVYAGTDGQYSINGENISSVYDNYNCVYLYDNAEKKAIDLSVEPNYVFYTSAGTHPRFDLLFSNSLTECEKLMDNQSIVQNIKDHISLRSSFGNWYIDYEFTNNDNQQLEISIYNTNGQLIVSPNRIGVNGAGNYKLDGLNELSGIYLIQIKSNDQVISKTISL